LLLTTKRKQTATLLLKTRKPLNVIHGSARFAKFNRARGNSNPRRSLFFEVPLWHNYRLRKRPVKDLVASSGVVIGPVVMSASGEIPRIPKSDRADCSGRLSDVSAFLLLAAEANVAARNAPPRRVRLVPETWRAYA
jgi:hypothetical protein